jgi:hypothetical protein
MMEKLRSRLKFIERKLMLDFKNQLTQDHLMAEPLGTGLKDKLYKNSKRMGIPRERK